MLGKAVSRIHGMNHEKREESDILHRGNPELSDPHCCSQECRLPRRRRGPGRQPLRLPGSSAAGGRAVFSLHHLQDPLRTKASHTRQLLLFDLLVKQRHSVTAFTES